MCGPLENGAKGPHGVGDTLKLSLALHHPWLPRSLLGRCFHRWHGRVYSADNIEPHLTGVVIRYLLVSDNASALPCKHHENRSESRIKVCVFA